MASASSSSAASSSAGYPAVSPAGAAPVAVSAPGPSIFAQGVDLVKRAAAATAEAVKSEYNSLQTPPSSIECDRCHAHIDVPIMLFAWKCPRCTLDNLGTARVCATCEREKPSTIPEVTIACPNCTLVNVVPSTMGSLRLKQAGVMAKSAFVTAKTWTEEQYAHMKSTPASFHCQFCNMKLENPNKAPVEGAAAPAAAAAAPGTTAAAAAPAVPVITQCVCPICHNTTRVPQSNFVSDVTHASSEVVKTGAKLINDIMGKRYAECPICARAVRLPEEPTPPAAAGAPAAAAVPVARPLERRVSLTCPNCNSKFDAKY